MSIQFKKGDLFQEEVEAIVNPVNTVGIMGKGLALVFKKRFPLNYKLYRQAYKEDKLKVGELLITETNQIILPKYIINFPTKAHWRSKSKMEYIVEGLDKLVVVIQEKQITSIAMPSLGCGLGGLKWEVVKAMIEEKLMNIEGVNIIVFEPL